MTAILGLLFIKVQCNVAGVITMFISTQSSESATMIAKGVGDVRPHGLNSFLFTNFPKRGNEILDPSLTSLTSLTVFVCLLTWITSKFTIKTADNTYVFLSTIYNYRDYRLSHKKNAQIRALILDAIQS